MNIDINTIAGVGMTLALIVSLVVLFRRSPNAVRRERTDLE